MVELSLQARHASTLILVGCKTQIQSNKREKCVRGVKKYAYLDDLIKCKVINIVAIFFLKDHEICELTNVIVFVHDFFDQISLFVLGAFWVEVCLLAIKFHAFGLCFYHLCQRFYNFYFFKIFITNNLP